MISLWAAEHNRERRLRIKSRFFILLTLNLFLSCHCVAVPTVGANLNMKAR